VFINIEASGFLGSLRRFYDLSIAEDVLLEEL